MYRQAAPFVNHKNTSFWGEVMMHLYGIFVLPNLPVPALVRLTGTRFDQ